MRYVFLAISLLLFNTGCLAQGSQAAGYPEPTTVEPAHDFSLETLNGQTVALSDFRGQWVLLNFWATWCKPCVQEMPYFQEMTKARDMVVLGVNFSEPADQVAEFVTEHKLSFPILLDPDDITLLVYQVRGLPRTFVIAPDGTIALRIVGEVNSAQLGRWLDNHLVD